MTAHFRSLKELFLAALEVAPADRAAWLESECGADADQREQLRLMLAAHDAPQSLLDRPADPVPRGGIGATASECVHEQPGAVIGHYKLLEQIGEGGMGTVWMAQQTEPVKRVVAVKLIKAGMDSKQVIARFEAERQALALMDHPNIAKVLDAGTTSEVRGQKSEVSKQLDRPSPTSDLCPLTSGRPYFVMDLVKGVPITRYCDEHHLTPRQRLELFIPVCQAVQHAHQKGIIHRDLKPSNVLVALYDGKPVPKVIDFGVAKASGQPLTEQTLVTGFGAIVGTLEYMSPEQAEINQLDIDTRSDIYSLGVLLYELLTGGPPFSRKELEKAGMLEMLRVIREQEPSKPSTKLSTAESLPTLAANRGTEPAKLTKLVKGELDWIVMKALEKDRNRRYETASGFAMDVQRYLADEPVQACPPSVGYRLRKFGRRNKAAVGTASVIVMSSLLALGVLLASYSMLAAKQQETETAKGLTEEALIAKTKALGESEAAKRDADQARLLAEKSAKILAGHLDWSRKLTRHNGAMAKLLKNTDRQEDAAVVYRELMTFYERLVQDFPDNTDYSEDLGKYSWNLGVFLEKTKQYPKAVEVFQRSAKAYETYTSRRGIKNDGEDSLYWVSLGNVQEGFGDVLHAAGKPQQAERAYQDAIKVWDLLFGLDKSGAWQLSRAGTQARLATLSWEAGKTEAAEKGYREALATLDKLKSTREGGQVGDSILRREQGAVHAALANLLWDSGRILEAQKHYRQGIQRWQSTRFQPQTPAWFLVTCPDPQFRDPVKALAFVERNLKTSPREGDLWTTQGVAHYRAGDFPQAVQALDRARQLHAGGTAIDWFFLAMAHAKRGDPTQAHKSYEQAKRWMTDHNPNDGELRRFRAECAQLLKLPEEPKKADDPKKAEKKPQFP